METPERTLIVGRSPDADVTLAEPSVAPRHAELVVTSRGRLHITDCASGSGTWLQDPASGAWRAVRQAFVAADARLRFGDQVCRAGDLVGRAGATPGHGPPGAASATSASGARRGRVERDPSTGEIVRRRF